MNRQLHKKSLRSIVWVGNSKDNLSKLPSGVKNNFGMQLYELQLGGTPSDMKPLTQFGSGIFELRDNYDGDTYRLVYVVKLKKAIYVLHAFMKKSKSGIGLPRSDVAMIEARLQHAREMDGKG